MEDEVVAEAVAEQVGVVSTVPEVAAEVLIGTEERSWVVGKLQDDLHSDWRV